MRKSCIIIIVLLIANIVNSQEMIKDKFGQLVPVSFENKIVEIKEYRLPNSGKYNPEKAVRLLEIMISQKPDYYRGHYNLALAYSELNLFDRAKANFDKAMNIREQNNIQDITIYNSAGFSRLIAQDYKNAEILFKKGIKEKQKNTTTLNRSLYNNLGLLYFYTQQFDKASSYLDTAKNKYNSKFTAQTLQVIEKLKTLKNK